jgi:pyrimidine nucleoside transport protein
MPSVLLATFVTLFSTPVTVLCCSDENNVLDAATKGAMLGIQLVLGIIANLIAFMAFLAFLNGVLSWLGMRVGVEGLSSEVCFRTIRS